MCVRKAQILSNGLPAYVVVMWWVPRKKKLVYYIPITAWINLRNNCGRKSITQDLCFANAHFIYDYLKRKEVKDGTKNLR